MRRFEHSGKRGGLRHTALSFAGKYWIRWTLLAIVMVSFFASWMLVRIITSTPLRRLPTGGMGAKLPTSTAGKHGGETMRGVMDTVANDNPLSLKENKPLRASPHVVRDSWEATERKPEETQSKEKEGRSRSQVELQISDRNSRSSKASEDQAPSKECVPASARPERLYFPLDSHRAFGHEGVWTVDSILEHAARYKGFPIGQCTQDRRTSVFQLGAMKSGTSTMFEFIARTFPGRQCYVKEPHWFDTRESGVFSLEYRMSEAGLSLYVNRTLRATDKSRFAYNATGECVRGFDFTPAYLRDPGAPLRIAKYLSWAGIDDPLFLVILRHPVHRAFSHAVYKPFWLKDVCSWYKTVECKKRASAIEVNGNITTVLRFVDGEHDRCEKEKRRDKINKCYSIYDPVFGSRYFEQFMRYFQYFDPRRFLVLSFDEVTRLKDTQSFKRMAAALSVFFGMPQYRLMKKPRVGSHESVPQTYNYSALRPEEVAKLEEMFFEEEFSLLPKLLGSFHPFHRTNLSNTA